MLGYYHLLDVERDPKTMEILEIALVKVFIRPGKSRICRMDIFLHPTRTKHEIPYPEESHVFRVEINKSKQMMCNLIAKNRNIPIISHAHVNDLDFLGEFSSTTWEKINHQCSAVLLDTHFPKFWDEYTQRKLPELVRLGRKSKKGLYAFETILEAFTRKQQSHSALFDCIDLFDILTMAVNLDDKDIPKGTFLESEWFTSSKLANKSSTSVV